jgi:hypothetical protein
MTKWFQTCELIWQPCLETNSFDNNVLKQIHSKKNTANIKAVSVKMWIKCQPSYLTFNSNINRNCLITAARCVVGSNPLFLVDSCLITRAKLKLYERQTFHSLSVNWSRYICEGLVFPVETTGVLIIPNRSFCLRKFIVPLKVILCALENLIVLMFQMWFREQVLFCTLLVCFHGKIKFSILCSHKETGCESCQIINPCTTHR